MLNSELIATESPRVQLRSKQQASHLLTGTLCITVLALFMGFIFNRYMPVNEGWFHYYSWMMHEGKVPYRDFWFFGPPLSLCWAWLFAGDHILNLRIFGLVEHIAVSGMLYFLLSRQFSPRASFLATTVSVLVFLGYVSESFFSYLVDALAFLLAGLICIFQAQVHPRHERILFLLAGVCGSLSFFSKQSSGLFATLALAVSFTGRKKGTNTTIPASTAMPIMLIVAEFIALEFPKMMRLCRFAMYNDRRVIATIAPESGDTDRRKHINTIVVSEPLDAAAPINTC